MSVNDDQVIELWTRREVADQSERLARGEGCRGCGAGWVPEAGDVRALVHLASCPYDATLTVIDAAWRLYD